MAKAKEKKGDKSKAKENKKAARKSAKKSLEKSGKNKTDNKKEAKKADNKSAKKTDTSRKKPKKKITKKGKGESKYAAKDSVSRKSLNVEVSSEERWLMIATAAYYKAERRGFDGGNDLQDWLDAEADIDRLLSGDQ